MNTNRLKIRPAAPDIRQMVEPLANFICATEEPKRALMSALAALVHEVESTNEVALTHFHTFSQN
jgi:hypothetical protein